jgi:transcriptional regulator with XRE-family HTH domain
MKLDARKVRAARALLDWGQKDLAERSGISHMAITNLEQGKTYPQSDTQEKIQNAFELAGVIFTPKGVEFKEETVTTIEGEGWYLRLLDDVYYTLLDQPGAEYLTMCADDRASSPEVNNRLRKIRNAGIRMRQLVQEGNTYLMGPVKEYRYIPKEQFKNNVSLIYGDKVAVCTQHATKAIVFKDADLAMTWRNIFDVMWEHLEQPKESRANERF